MPQKGSSTFAVKTIIAIGSIMSGIKIQAGHEKEKHLPAEAKLAVLLALIILISACRSRVIILGIAAAMLVYLCTWPPMDLWGIIRPSLIAAAAAFLLLLPAMLTDPSGMPNNLAVVIKVFLCLAAVTIFNHTTQWNHVTSALRKLHIPAIFIFTLDITLKYIVLLGGLIRDLLTSALIRTVGKADKKYSSVGGIMGVTFVRGTEMNGQMYEAMRCRGFTDDYKGL